MTTTTLHSNYGGYNIFKSEEGRYFVAEPYLNHVGILRYREAGNFETHKEVREYCQNNAAKWAALHDQIDNA